MNRNTLVRTALLALVIASPGGLLFARARVAEGGGAESAAGLSTYTIEGSLANGQASATFPISITTLPAGDSVIVTFEVTVNTPVPPGVSEVCNQGTVSGSNFGSVLTDDPDLPGAADPTCTGLVTGDIGVIAINAPNSGASLTSSETVTITIQNFTSTPQSGFNVRYQVTGPINTGPITEAFVGTLAANSTGMHSFSTGADLSSTGIYTITANTLLAGDGNAANDTTTKMVEHFAFSPVVADAGTDTSGCLGKAFQLDGTATGGDGSYTFTWKVNTGPNTSSAQFSNTAAEDPTFTPTLAGSYVLRFKVDDGVTLPDSDNVNITVNALPAVTFNPPAGPIYDTDMPTNLAGFGSPAGGTFSGPGISGTNFNPAAAGAGMHSIKYVYSNGACADSVTKTITVTHLTLINGSIEPKSKNAKQVSGQFKVDIALKNISSTSFNIPIRCVFASLNPAPPTITVANADGGGTGLGSYFDYSTLVGSNNILTPNETSAYKTWIFNNPSAVNFTFFVNVYSYIPGVPKMGPGETIMVIVNAETGEVSLDALGGQEPAALPSGFSLAQNYPNPFNPTTSISFRLPETLNTSLIIYNLAGRLVRTLVHGETAAGDHTVVWDATDESGNRIASGMYVYVLKAGEFSAQRRLVLLK